MAFHRLHSQEKRGRVKGRARHVDVAVDLTLAKIRKLRLAQGVRHLHSDPPTLLRGMFS
jgi:hypothetical protein